ncbi:hypothetical protein ABK040_012341 [Willaertia magna]
MLKDDITEYEEDQLTVSTKVKELAKLIEEAKHVVIYTGAGISTSAGIPDFRGPKGVWTLKEKGLKPERQKHNYIKLPTLCHMAISQLYKMNKIHYVTSQNVDGLHMKSGIPRKDMSELHGNTNVEVCSKCGLEHIRDYKCRNSKEVHDHKTGRKCTSCGGMLKDTIINFNEDLPELQLERAIENAKKADLAIVLGTSLRVSPACDLPEKCRKRGGKLVIVNLQHTPKDNVCDLRIYAKTDPVIKELMSNLNIEIPSFILTKKYRFGLKKDSISKEFYFEPFEKGNLLSSNIKEITCSIYSGDKLLKEVKDNRPVVEKVASTATKVVINLDFNLAPIGENIPTNYVINYLLKKDKNNTLVAEEKVITVNIDTSNYHFDVKEE